MKVHVIPDVAVLTRDRVPAGKVGSGVHEQKRPEFDVLHLETQQPEKIADSSVANDLGVNLRFSVDKETGEHVVKVLDPESGDVIHQYPPEEFLQFVKNVRNLKGALFSARL